MKLGIYLVSVALNMGILIAMYKAIKIDPFKPKIRGKLFEPFLFAGVAGFAVFPVVNTWIAIVFAVWQLWED